MGETYYLSINSSNLGSYYSRACISPAKYIANRQQDIQSKFNNVILLSEKKLIAGENCSLEIVLTNSEQKLLFPLAGGDFLFERPLPITRVKSIIFISKKQRDETLWNINNGAAFVSESRTQIEENSSNEDVLGLLDAEYPNFSTDWTNTLGVYDRILGCFALMKISGNSDWEYSENYFKTISYINLSIEKDLESSGIHFSNAYGNVFSNLKATLDKYSHVEIADVQKQAHVEGIRLEKDLGVLKLDNIDTNSDTYSLAILSNYGLNARKSIDDFIAHFKSGKIPTQKDEKIAMLFGINTGYKAFRNGYKTSSFDIEVKYHLDSQVDYYTIESLYQFVFLEKRDNSSYDYLNSWIPKLDPKPLKKGFYSYRVLDKTVIHSIRPKLGSKEYLDSLFQKASSKMLYKKIVSILSQHFPPFVSINDDLAITHVEKELNSPMRTVVKSVFEASQIDLLAEQETKDASLLSEVTALSEQLATAKIKYENLKEENDQLKLKLHNPELTSESAQKSIHQETESDHTSGQTDTPQDDSSNYNTVSQEDLDLVNMTLGEMKDLARELGIKRLGDYKSKDKSELRGKIRTARKSINPINFSGNTK
jgi:hypothetical protein